ncbi:MAG: IS4 family transposase [Planctomycetaceae bacterium]|nr:IS4 family transposase [Planctomycetaceae bacterium]
MFGPISDELAKIDLGDKRLNRRSRNVIEKLAADTEASINGAFETWSDTLAAYRLFDNPRVTPEAILEPHYQATRDRIAQQPVVVIAQDTTDMDLSKHPPKDAGCLTKPDRFGFYNHTQLATTPAGLPLGLVGVTLFDREAESLGKANERRHLPIEQKESIRWLDGYRRANALAQQCPNTQVISVADREADMYDIFQEAERLRGEGIPRAHYVIRSKENRRLDERIPPAEHNSRNAVYRKLYAEVPKSPVRFRTEITLPATPKRGPRKAKLEVRARSVILKYPKNRPGMQSVRCQIVHVREVGRTAPAESDNEGEANIEWWLLTSLPVNTRKEIERVIQYYRARWQIEVYFRTLKTGCRVEQIRLETVARVKNCLAFYQIIAWRVLCVTHLSRVQPDLPCDEVFTDSEWQSVWQITTRKPVPAQPPALREFTKLLASLGGYNNRKTERPPGPQTLWTGMRRMFDFALAWRLLGTVPKSCV